jgi:hypothetical protein
MSYQKPQINTTFKKISTLLVLSFTLSSSLYASSTAVNVRALAPVSVTINQSSTQADPATSSPVKFTVVFSEAINTASFETSDIILTGTAPGAKVTQITQVAPNNGTTFEVTVTATGTGTIIASMPEFSTVSSAVFGTAGTDPNAIAFDAAGNLYVANQTSNNVTKITTAGGSSVFGTTGKGPIAIAVDSSGNVYTANNTANSVTKITPAGVSSVLGTTDTNPTDIALDSSGNVYTANYNGNSVTKITPAGISTTLASTGPTTNPASLVVDSTGNVYTANNNTHNVSKITPAGVATILASTGASTFPVDLVLDSIGNVYTANSDNGKVKKITPAGLATDFATTGSTPQAITIDSQNNLYVADSIDNNVTKITPDGNPVVFSTTGAGPKGIALDSLGNVYTVSNTVGVTKITAPRGVYTVSEATSSASTSTDNSITLSSTTSGGTSGNNAVVSSTVEAGAPNNGDGNNDGIPDNTQPNVVSLPSTVNSKYITLAATGGTCGNITSINTSSQSNTSSLSFPAGAVNFTSSCASAGQTFNAELIFFGTYDLNQATLQKINGTTVTAVTGVTKSLVTIGGQSAIKFSYAIVDGGANDQDGAANGTIVDPVALGVSSVTPTASNSLIRTGGITENSQSIFVGILAALLAGITWKINNRKASQSK